MTTRYEQLAEAFEQAAFVNHYMVGVTTGFTESELDRAEQILINRQNTGPQSGTRFDTLTRALDLIEAARKEYFR